MFKRFQPPKAPPPFPPIEEDIRCPQCGFNHDGWAFEPGYAKLCVKCGVALEAYVDPEESEGKNNKGAGFFGKVLGGVFGRKKEQQAGEETGEEQDPTGADLETHEESPVPEEITAGATETAQEPSGPTLPPEEPEQETDDTPEYADPCAAPSNPEAVHVGACKREGRLFAEQGRYEEAIEMFEKVVAFEPNDVDTWCELGRIHYKGTQDLSSAIECSRKALEIDEDLVSVKCTLCLALLFDGQYDLAKKGFLEVIRSVRNSRDYGEEFQENCKALLHDCLGELYVSKKEASGERLACIKDIIDLLEIEKIYFH